MIRLVSVFVNESVWVAGDKHPSAIAKVAPTATISSSVSDTEMLFKATILTEVEETEPYS
jgi:hypothetical protein